MAHPHRIRRQRWALCADSAAAAFTLRQRLRDDWQEVLLPVFQKVFDQEVPGEDVVHLRRIELTLKVAAGEKTGASWPALIHDQLLRQLREILRAWHDAPENPAEWTRSTARLHQFENLLHYLHTGSVRWEAAGIPATELAAELEKTCRERWPALPALVHAGPAPSLAFCFRLLQLLPPAEAGAAVRALLGAASAPWQVALFEALASLLAPEHKHFTRHTQLQLAAFVLSEALAARRNETVPDFVRLARSAVPGGTSALTDFIASLPAPDLARAKSDSISKKTETAATREIGLSTKNSIPTFPPEVPGALPKEEPPGRRDKAVPDLVRGRGRDRPFEGEAPAADHAPSISEENAAWAQIYLRTGALRSASLAGSPGAFAEEEPPASSHPADTPSLFQAAAAGFSLLAAHAGLVLLHPFLPRFFEGTGIKGKNRDDLAPFVLPRAAALLHFLATGEDAIYEYDLALIKVLLGVSPETPLCVSEGLLKDPDRQETEALLQAAIMQWAALKNTSTAGFRSSFLQRPALLREEDQGWRMQVERQPFDLLLEYLPWSISVVKLPWMKRPLYLEW